MIIEFVFVLTSYYYDSYLKVNRLASVPLVAPNTTSHIWTHKNILY